MKKNIILWALLLTFSAATAQGPGSGYPCPSELIIHPLYATGKAHKFKLRLSLYNDSQNLNGFFVRLSKSELARWVMVDKENATYFTTKGYGKNILARWEDKTDEEREEEFEQHCDVDTGVFDEKLTIAEVLTTNVCPFFPVGNDIGVGEFAIDLSDCEDGLYYIGSDITPLDYVFSYTGGDEGTCGWTPDYGLVMELYKQGDLVSIYPWFPMDDYDGVEEVEKDKSVASVRYYNLAGVESAQPVKGVNIKVTTYSDGTTKSEKIVR